MIEFSCQCGNVMRVQDGAAGRTGTCKQCGSSVRVPSPIARVRPTPVTPTVVANAPAPTYFEPSPFSTQPSQQTVTVHVHANEQKSNGTLGIASCFLGGLAFLVCWIPLVGMLGLPLSTLGLCLGLFGIMIGLMRRGRGMLLSFVGTAVSGLALFIAAWPMFMAAAVIAGPAVEQAREAARRTAAKNAEKEVQRQAAPVNAQNQLPDMKAVFGEAPPVKAPEVPVPDNSSPIVDLRPPQQPKQILPDQPVEDPAAQRAQEAQQKAVVDIETRAAKSLELGRRLMADGKSDRAADWFRQLIKQYPNTQAAADAELLLRTVQ